MTRAEFDAKWGALAAEGRDAWLRLEVLTSPDAGSLGRDCPYADAVERRGLCERYALTLAGLVEEPHEYGQRSRGWQFWRLAHAPADLRAKAALMTVLNVEV